MLQGRQTIAINGDFAAWHRVSTEYRDTIGDTCHRDYDGYGGLHYQDDSGRNDFVTLKVAADAEQIYFYAATREALTPHTGSNWMLLLIDADQNAKTGWFGYDYVINLKVLDAQTTTLMRYAPNSPAAPWQEVARLPMHYASNQLQLAVPRRLLNLSSKTMSFDFKWADNPSELKDPISLCTSGDTAPNRRFNYRCLWKE